MHKYLYEFINNENSEHESIDLHVKTPSLQSCASYNSYNSEIYEKGKYYVDVVINCGCTPIHFYGIPEEFGDIPQIEFNSKSEFELFIDTKNEDKDMQFKNLKNQGWNRTDISEKSIEQQHEFNAEMYVIPNNYLFLMFDKHFCGLINVLVV